MSCVRYSASTRQSSTTACVLTEYFQFHCPLGRGKLCLLYMISIVRHLKTITSVIPIGSFVLPLGAHDFLLSPYWSRWRFSSMEIIRTAAECSRFRACCFSSAALRIIRYSFAAGHITQKLLIKQHASVNDYIMIFPIQIYP